MSVRPRLALASPLAAAVACAALACATGTPRGLLRVELGGSEAAASPAEARLVDAVRGAASAEGLACRPGTGADLLRCTPAAVGNQGHALIVTLRHAGSGYAVAVEQPVRLPGMSSPVCEAQARISGRIAAELGAPAVRVDARSDCKQRR